MLVHSIILSIGGIPLIYSGDELGLTNDYSYEQDEEKKHDQRWVHRIKVQNKHIKNSPNKAITEGLMNLIKLRQQHDVFGDSQTHFIDPPNQHCFAYYRVAETKRCLCLVNFSEHELLIDSQHLTLLGSDTCFDLVSSTKIDCKQELKLSSYQFVWLFVS